MNSIIKVRISEETKKRLERLAKAESKTLDQFIIERLLDRTKANELQPETPPEPQPEPPKGSSKQ